MADENRSRVRYGETFARIMKHGSAAKLESTEVLQGSRDTSGRRAKWHDDSTGREGASSGRDTDMHKGIDGLAMLVQGRCARIRSREHLFVSRGRKAIVFWDGTGVASNRCRCIISADAGLGRKRPMSEPSWRERAVEVERLRLIIQRLQRAQFGRRSERLNGDQLELGLEYLWPP